MIYKKNENTKEKKKNPTLQLEKKNLVYLLICLLLTSLQGFI